MKQHLAIPVWLAAPLVTALIGLEGWLCWQVADLRTQHAALTVKIEMHMAQERGQLAHSK